MCEWVLMQIHCFRVCILESSAKLVPSCDNVNTYIYTERHDQKQDLTFTRETEGQNGYDSVDSTDQGSGI